MRKHILFYLAFMLLSRPSYSQSCFDKKPFDGGGKQSQADHDQAQYNVSFKGCLMPAFQAVTTTGKAVSNTTLNGNIVVMYFWTMDATRLMEAPYLNSLADSFKGKPVRFIGICEGDPARWDRRAEKYFHFDLVSRSAAVLGKFRSKPVIIVFDTHGQTLFSEFGFYDSDVLIRERSLTIRKIIEANLPAK